MKKTLKKIPAFKSVQEEADFWDTHDTTEYFDYSKAKKVSFPNLKPSTDPKFLPNPPAHRLY